MVWEAQWNLYLGLGHHSGDPRGDPMVILGGDSYGKVTGKGLGGIAEPPFGSGTSLW